MKSPKTWDGLHPTTRDVAAVVRSRLAKEAGSDIALTSSAWGPVFETDDCDHMREYVAGYFSDFSLEQSGRARHHVMRHRQARLGSLRIHEFHHLQAVGELRLAAPGLPELYLLEFNLAGGAILCHEHRDVPFAEGQLYVINADQLHRKRWRANNRRIIVGIEREQIEAITAEMIGHPLRTPLLFEPAPSPIDRVTAALAMSVALICADLDGSGMGLARRRAARAAERLLIELLIEALPNNYSHRIRHEPPAVTPGYMKRVVEYVHKSADEPIGPDDMASVAGVSARTLYDAFRRHYGVTPMAYLRSVRLEYARDALISRARTASSVTEVALDCGFNHLGKFARAYRSRFGELPSETLRRHR